MCTVPGTVAGTGTAAIPSGTGPPAARTVQPEWSSVLIIEDDSCRSAAAGGATNILKQLNEGRQRW
ncbi:hypothetical protein Ate01nite_56110 [Actinoplanes teichomyceticus]|nr:hypothetical protein Ate01nite_56110 [Actinoplanes teichomyceticus]